MSSEVAFVLINPYTIAKSRTGGVIARYIARTDLRLAAAQMFGPNMDLVREYAELIRHADPEHPDTCAMIADYVLTSYAPNPATGRPRRVMMLLFEGEDAIRKIWDVTGNVTIRLGCGETIRETYGDFILDDQNHVKYFEPAVLVAPTPKRAKATLGLWSRYSARDGGIVGSAMDIPEGEHVERTLVLLKPDNFRFPSARPGSIIDLLSRSGLRIVGIKKFRMTVAQAEEFYGPVRAALQSKFGAIGGSRVSRALSNEFGFPVPETSIREVCDHMAPVFANQQFEEIVKFMTGFKPSECAPTEKETTCREECLALVYEGVDAVSKIRSILGPTDPRQAQPGSVRREFGSDIMVNAAHASDSPENAKREMKIIKVEEDSIKPWLDRYYGNA